MLPRKKLTRVEESHFQQVDAFYLLRGWSSYSWSHVFHESTKQLWGLVASETSCFIGILTKQRQMRLRHVSFLFTFVIH